MTDRYDSLMPRDLLITLRSLPRRFDTVHDTATKTSQLVERIDQPGPAGQSLSELVNDTVRVLADASPAIGAILTSDSPTVTIYELGSMDEDDQLSVKRAVVDIRDRATSIADRLNDISADDWSRTAIVPSTGSMALVDLVRHCVRSSVETLRAAERQVEWMQAQ